MVIIEKKGAKTIYKSETGALFDNAKDCVFDELYLLYDKKFINMADFLDYDGSKIPFFKIWNGLVDIITDKKNLHSTVKKPYHLLDVYFVVIYDIYSFNNFNKILEKYNLYCEIPDPGNKFYMKDYWEDEEPYFRAADYIVRTFKKYI